MSKHSRKRARKRKIARLRSKPSNATAALSVLADALNTCEKFTKVKLRHGIVVTHYGYVFQMSDGRWAAKNLNFAEFSHPEGDDDDED